MRTMKPGGLALVLAMGLVCGAQVLGDEPASVVGQAPVEGPALSIWQDPTFERQFLGSYGFQAELEPKLSTVERQQLEKIWPLLGTDQAAAAAAIEKVNTPQSSAVFDFTLGNIAFQSGDLDTAATHYEAALAKFPSFRRAWKNLGVIRVRQGRYDDAIKPLSRVIEMGGGDGTTFGLLGFSYGALGQHVQAESAYRTALLLQPDVLDWKTGLAQSALRQQKYPEVASLMEELLKAHPDRTDYWLMQANAFIGMNQPLKAAEDFEILMAMDKATAGVLQTLGDIYSNESLWDAAARAYLAALNKDTTQTLARPLRNVEVLAQRGALSQARQLLARVQEIYGAQADAADRGRLLKLSARIALADKDDATAVAALEEVVALDPLDGEALMLLGQHYARMNQPDKGIFYYERAESIESFEADARVRHAQILVNESRPAEAVPLLKRAQEIKPREDVGRYLEQVERAAKSRN